MSVRPPTLDYERHEPDTMTEVTPMLGTSYATNRSRRLRKHPLFAPAMCLLGFAMLLLLAMIFFE